MGVTDSLKLASLGRHLYSILFYCRLEGGEPRPHPLEALEVGFFSLEQLPEPLHGTNRRWITLASEFHFRDRREAYFDDV
jgi:hypothetical protein